MKLDVGNFFALTRFLDDDRWALCRCMHLNSPSSLVMATCARFSRKMEFANLATIV